MECGDCKSELHFCKIHQKREIELEKKGLSTIDINFLLLSKEVD